MTIRHIILAGVIFALIYGLGVFVGHVTTPQTTLPHLPAGTTCTLTVDSHGDASLDNCYRGTP